MLVQLLPIVIFLARCIYLTVERVSAIFLFFLFFQYSDRAVKYILFCVFYHLFMNRFRYQAHI